MAWRDVFPAGGSLRKRGRGELTSSRFHFAPHRSVLRLDLQRVPAVCAAGQPPLHLAGDGEPVHRQGGALGRGQLHLRGEQHRHPEEGAQLSDAAATQDGR